MAHEIWYAIKQRNLTKYKESVLNIGDWTYVDPSWQIQ